ncbi:unspecific monooxygenase [Streptomyces sp. DvalAA-14]|uniref:cytochrome P450 n=1 Tax=unclassified Streptomyces TaxID=2593676 RepID=UPI00081B53A6|nr:MULTISPECIES: cytochrome P450 [unclassified Streptomyces]MYS24424.1 cytochrome P450 [Streptomyces sp. SID4948]SCE45885.1 unspecific monooxygenase [Streptomyces sp. DvalAA-14]
MTEAPAFDPSFVTQLLPFNPFDPAFHADPYPVFRKIREESGGAIRTPAGIVTLLDHAHVTSVLSDPKFGWGDSEAIRSQELSIDGGEPTRFLAMQDPPDHTRLRGLVSKAFTPRMVERLRSRTQEITDRLLAEARAEAAAGNGTVDLVDRVFRPLGGLVLTEMMGIPEEFHALAFEYSADSARGLDPDFTLTPEQARKRDEGRLWFARLTSELARRRRAEPGDDLISDLVQVQEGDDGLTDNELAVICVNLLAAGFGATAAQMSNSALALLQNPDQLEWLRAHPDRVGGATEELLRFDGPLFLLTRAALEPTEVAGFEIAAGEQVFLSMGSASHDPAVYADPDRLDLSRTPTKVLGYGHGIHFCVAAPVARLATQVALNSLARHTVELAVEQPPFNGALVIRTLAELPVRLSAPAAG